MSPEARARQTIDALLNAAGWHVCDVANTNWPARARPLPFVLESAGAETRFTNGLAPQSRARPAFAFFRPELLVQWLTYLLAKAGSAMGATDLNEAPAFLRRMQQLPPLATEWEQGGAHFKLWPAQIKAITNLEASLATNKQRALTQMATGRGETLTDIYRLIKFGEKFIVQHLWGNPLNKSARVVIRTIQRMFSMFKGTDIPDEADEESTEVDRHLSAKVEAEVNTNLQRALSLRQAILTKAIFPASFTEDVTA